MLMAFTNLAIKLFCNYGAKIVAFFPSTEVIQYFEKFSKHGI